MANKKKNSPADDLIDQLIDDVNNIETVTTAAKKSAEENPFFSAAKPYDDGEDQAFGLAPNGKLDENTRNGDILIWEDVENLLSAEAMGEDSPFDLQASPPHLKAPQVYSESSPMISDVAQMAVESDEPTHLPIPSNTQFREKQQHYEELQKMSMQREAESAKHAESGKSESADVIQQEIPAPSPADNFYLSDLPKVEAEKYDGPSADGGYQSPDEIFAPAAVENEPTMALSSANDEATEGLSPARSGGGGFSIVAGGAAAGGEDNEATLAASGFIGRGPLQKMAPQEKVVIGTLKGHRGGNVLTAVDASLAQAESLKIAQQRILELEKENDRLRQENEELGSAGDIIKNRSEELTSKVQSLEREKQESYDSYQSELLILKGNLAYKESEAAKARLKIDELQSRLKADFKRIRVRERELENRLELARAEKSALVKAKDDNIIELKRKIDQLQGEIDNYRDKCLDLNKTIEQNQEQFKRTVRALKLALTNLEVNDENIISLKKAE